MVLIRPHARAHHVSSQAANIGDTTDGIVAAKFQRPIGHPSFRNSSRAEVEEELTAMARFEALFRPHRTSTDRITLTWKFKDGVFAHYLVLEKEKNPEKPLLLGSRLEVLGRSFEDLDEVLATYVSHVFVCVW